MPSSCDGIVGFRGRVRRGRVFGGCGRHGGLGRKTGVVTAGVWHDHGLTSMRESELREGCEGRKGEGTACQSVLTGRDERTPDPCSKTLGRETGWAGNGNKVLK